MKKQTWKSQKRSQGMCVRACVCAYLCACVRADHFFSETSSLGKLHLCLSLAPPFWIKGNPLDPNLYLTIQSLGSLGTTPELDRTPYRASGSLLGSTVSHPSRGSVMFPMSRDTASPCSGSVARPGQGSSMSHQPTPIPDHVSIPILPTLLLDPSLSHTSPSSCSRSLPASPSPPSYPRSRPTSPSPPSSSRSLPASPSPPSTLLLCFICSRCFDYSLRDCFLSQVSLSHRRTRAPRLFSPPNKRNESICGATAHNRAAVGFTGDASRAASLGRTL